MRVLLTGASGFFGSHFAARYCTNFELIGTVGAKAGPADIRCIRVNLRDSSDLRTLYDAIRPSIVIHAAALSRVLSCEDQPETAWQINVASTETLALLCRRDGVKLIYFSSDQVFDGSRGLYRTTDQTNPINQYGRTKLAAEHVVLDASARNLIFRSNSIVGRQRGWGESFTDLIWKALSAGQSFRAFHDQFRSPIHISQSLAMLNRCIANDARGIVHAGGMERLHRVDLANWMQDIANLSGAVEAISLSEHPQASIMPVDTSYEPELDELLPPKEYEPLKELLRLDYGNLLKAAK